MAQFVVDAITFNTTAGNKTVAITPAVGELLIVVAANTGTTTDPTVTDDRGGTYTRIAAASCAKATSADEMHFYVRDRPCQVELSHTITMNVGGAGTGGGAWAARISGMGKYGANAVRQATKQDNQAAAGTPTATFALPILAESLCVFAVFNATNPAGMTPPASFTEQEDVGYATPTTGLEVATRDNGQTGLTITAGGTSASAFCMLAVELDTATPTASGGGRMQTPGQPHETRRRRLHFPAFGEAAVGYQLDAQSESFAVAGVDATLAADRVFNAEPATYAVTGVAATVAAGKVFSADPGTYTVTGTAATIVPGYAVNAAAGSFTVTGFVADLVYTQVGAFTLDAQPGSFVVTGNAANTTLGRLVVASPGTYTVSGAVADLVHQTAGAFTINAAPGTFAVSGVNATTVATRVLDVSPASYAVTGTAAALFGEHSINAATGAYAVAGTSTAIVATRLLSAAPGVYTFTGFPASIGTLFDLEIDATPGAFAVTGNTATLLWVPGLVRNTTRGGRIRWNRAGRIEQNKEGAVA